MTATRKKSILVVMLVMLLTMVVSSFTSTVDAATRPGQVKNVKVTNVNGTTLTVSWKKVSGAKKYKIYRKSNKKGDTTYKLVKTTTSTSWKNTGLKAGYTYYYKIKAVNSKGRSSKKYSSVKKCTTKLNTPSVKSLDVEKYNNNYWTITLTTSKVSGASSYIWYYKRTGDDEWNKLTSTTKTTATYKTQYNSTYTFRVRAYARGANSTTVYSSYSKTKKCNVWFYNCDDSVVTIDTSIFTPDNMSYTARTYGISGTFSDGETLKTTDSSLGKSSTESGYDLGYWHSILFGECSNADDLGFIFTDSDGNEATFLFSYESNVTGLTHYCYMLGDSYEDMTCLIEIFFDPDEEYSSHNYNITVESGLEETSFQMSYTYKGDVFLTQTINVTSDSVNSDHWLFLEAYDYYKDEIDAADTIYDKLLYVEEYISDNYTYSQVDCIAGTEILLDGYRTFGGIEGYYKSTLGKISYIYTTQPGGSTSDSHTYAYFLNDDGNWKALSLQGGKSE